MDERTGQGNKGLAQQKNARSNRAGVSDHNGSVFLATDAKAFDQVLVTGHIF
jgi:hypothetical protein